MDGKEGGERGAGRRLVREAAPFLTMGIQLALAVVVFFFLGRWLDGLWGTAPWMMLAGLLVGVVGGFMQFFRAVGRLGREGEGGGKTRGGGRVR